VQQRQHGRTLARVERDEFLGALADIEGLVAGEAGTQVVAA